MPSARTTRQRAAGGGQPRVGGRASDTTDGMAFFSHLTARISTCAAARKCDCAGHVSLNCGFARSSLRKDSTAPIWASAGGKNFNLCARKLKFLPRSRSFPVTDAGAETRGRNAEDERISAPTTKAPLASRGRHGRQALGRLRRGLRLRVAADTGGRRLGACGAGSACESRPAKKAAVKGRWAGVPIGPFAYGSGTSEFALRNLHKSPDCRVGALPHLRASTYRRHA